jgi:hypothetical protein
VVEAGSATVTVPPLTAWAPPDELDAGPEPPPLLQPTAASTMATAAISPARFHFLLVYMWRPFMNILTTLLPGPALAGGQPAGRQLLQ